MVVFRKLISKLQHKKAAKCQIKDDLDERHCISIAIQLLKLNVDFTANLVASRNTVIGLGKEAATSGCHGDAMLKDCDSLLES